MVECQVENKVPGGPEDEGGGVNSAVECGDYSGDESTISIEYDDDDDDLTTDGGREGGVALAATQEMPSFGSVSVNNSTDIHFGNKTFYHGPVTIKQVVYASSGKESGEAVEDAVPGFKTAGLSRPQDDVQVTKETQDVEHHGALKLCLGQASRRRRCFVWVLTLSVVVLAASLTLLLVLVSRSDADSDDPSSKLYRGELPEVDQPGARYDVTLSGKLRILGRKDWLAQPSTQPRESLKLPVPYVIISHTASEQCYSQAECVFYVRTVQTFHIESRKWADIAYNFLVGGDGYVYTGRGWDFVGAHSYGYNTCSIGISFIGTFIEEHPTPSQFLAAQQLIEEGVRRGKISKNYKLLGHRQVSPTESPGQALFDDIKVLPHWLETPQPCKNATIMWS